jgi:hypothetical protein
MGLFFKKRSQSESRNRRLTDMMRTSGYDLVQVTNHNSDHLACKAWEGKVLSVSGNTPTGTRLAGGFNVAASLDEAKAAGLFHINCKHAINVLIPELAAKTSGYDNPYNKLSAVDKAKADEAFRNRNRKK